MRSFEDITFYFNTILNFLFKGFSIAGNFILVPLLLATVGKEGYGVWQTILSFVSWASLLNFGLGNGLRNVVAKLYIDRDFVKIGRMTSSTIILCLKIIVPLSIILIPLLNYIDFSFLFLNSSVAIGEIKYSIIIFFGFFLLNIILGLSISLAFGLQRSYLFGLINTLYLGTSLILVYCLNLNYSLNLIHLAYIFGGVQSTLYLILFIWENYRFKLNISLDSDMKVGAVTKLSVNFFLIQLLTVFYLSIDNFVISSTLGASITADYSIVNRLFFSLINVYSVFLIQFWNSVTHAYEKENFRWIKRKTSFLLKIAFVLFLLSLLLSFFSGNILDFWLGSSYGRISESIFYVFSVYTLLHCINAIFVNIQNGIGKLKFQMYSMLLCIFIYGIGFFLFDISLYGFKLLIILKIVGLIFALGLNYYSIKFIYEKDFN